MSNKLWLIGAGGMSLNYAKVLRKLNKDVICICRREVSAKKFEEITGFEVIWGGLERFLNIKPEQTDFAVVSVSVEELRNVTLQLLNYGIKKILVEKPAGVNIKEIREIRDSAHKNEAQVYVAYNRRFYASVIKAKEIIQDDGGVISFNYDFTEWSHTIETLEKGNGVKENWFLANSSHVVDMAFFLGGKPREITYYTAGNLSWHPSSAIFTGSGISNNGALFSYHANWMAPGRWGVEILTRKHKLIFQPLEKLQIQSIGSTAIEDVPIDDKLDIAFKPGLYLQVKNFIMGKTEEFCTIDEQLASASIYNKIAGYR